MVILLMAIDGYFINGYYIIVGYYMLYYNY